ncbi:MAG: pilus (MSHA type) biogenesis protein MshL [Gallionella sp.]
MRSRNLIYLYTISIILVGCGTNPIKPSDKHIQRQVDQSTATTGIPETVKRSVALPPPKPVTKVETYSVVVTNVPAQEILFALARDAKINLDIHSGIQGTVTVNAINQTLPQILTRIARQVDMRYELDNGYLTVMPDSPYLHNYKIDYVNMERDSDGSISNSSLVGSGATGSTAGGAGSGGNSSSLAIKNTSKNHFWETLIQNVKDILHETDKILPAGSSEISVQQIREASSTGTGVQTASGSKKSAPKDGIENSPNPVSVEEGGMTVTRRNTFREAASVIANPENGIITVRATGKQHEKIQEFIDQIMTSARRQVLIEATIVEVKLSDNYQQGIDWSRFALGLKGFSLEQTAGAGLPTAGNNSMLTLGYLNPTSKFGNLAANITLLESFGNVKVLSSPKLSVMNNQTAMLRVVDNKVYFTVNSTIGTCTPAPCIAPIAYTTTVNTVPIGFTMSVTPQINDNDTVLISVRPSITRLLTNALDPTPNLAFANSVPQTSTREMESVLKIENNQTAVLGGLMEDRINKLTDEVPGLASIPLLGNLFKNRNDTTEKTELVIFLRPVVIKDADVNGDFSAYRNALPDQDFFNESASGKP